MTSLAFVLGCIPLMLSSGSGALARNAIGTVVVIGMGVATLVGAFLIPCSYVFIMRLFRIKFSLNDLKEDPDEVGARKYLAAHTKDLCFKYCPVPALTIQGSAGACFRSRRGVFSCPDAGSNAGSF